MFHFPEFPAAQLSLHHALPPAFPRAGFPIRISADHSLTTTPRKLFAVVHVLPRPLAPRHPPYALRSLTCCATEQQPRSHCSLLTPTAVLLYPIQFLMCQRYLTTSAAIPPGNLLPTSNHEPGLTDPVGLRGLEPRTPALSAQCSNQLSYRPSPHIHNYRGTLTPEKW